MTSSDELRRVYTEIADVYQRRGQGQIRDRFLVLAADAAQTSGQPGQAEQLRRRLLHVSPHHLLKPFASFAQALDSPDLLSYVQDLRKNYPPKTAEELLSSLKQEDSLDGGLTLAEPVDSTLALAATLPPASEPPIYKLREQHDNAAWQAQLLPPTLPPGTRVSGLSFEPSARPTPKSSSPRPAVSPSPAPLRPAKAASRPVTPLTFAPPVLRDLGEPLQDDGPFSRGAWLPAVLVGLVMTAGVILLGYTLLAPFLSGGVIQP